MRANSRFRNYRLVFEPQMQRYDQHGRRIGMVQGIAVEFKGTRSGFWDSHAAQEINGWNDETREQVEEFLANHPDRGKFFHIEDAPAPQAQPEGSAPQQGTVETPCIGTIITPGEPSRICGKPATQGDYCDECAPEMAEV